MNQTLSIIMDKPSTSQISSFQVHFGTLRFECRRQKKNWAVNAKFSDVMDAGFGLFLPGAWELGEVFDFLCKIRKGDIDGIQQIYRENLDSSGSRWDARRTRIWELNLPKELTIKFCNALTELYQEGKISFVVLGRQYVNVPQAMGALAVQHLKGLDISNLDKIQYLTEKDVDDIEQELRKYDYSD